MSIVSLVETLIHERQAVLLLGKSYQSFIIDKIPYFEFCEKPVQSIVLSTMLRVLTKYGQTVRQLESKVNELEQAQKTEKTIRLAKRALQQNQNNIPWYTGEPLLEYLEDGGCTRALGDKSL